MTRNLILASAVALLIASGSIFSSSPLMAQNRTNQTEFQVAVTEKGFEPSHLIVSPNVLTKITFTRKTDATCATEVVIPEYNIKRTLPLTQSVTVEFTPKGTGDVAFACGMGMFKGSIVVQQQ